MQTTLLTSGDIARTLDRGADCVRHILNSRRDIQPVARAGIVRLYGDDVVERVAAELALIEARKAKLA